MPHVSAMAWRAIALLSVLQACSHDAPSPGSPPDGGVVAGSVDAGNGGAGIPDVGDGGAGIPDAGDGGAGIPDGGPSAPDAGVSPDALGPTPAACPSGFDALPTGDAPAAAVVDGHAGDALAAAWEIRPAPGRAIAFGGVVDASGNVYWTESPLDPAAGAPELVSATRDGAIRFRAPVSTGPLLLAEVLVASPSLAGGCAVAPCAALEGHSLADGSRTWRRDLTGDLEPWMRTPGDARYAALSGLAASSGRLLVGASLLDHVTLEHESGYVALDAAMGDLLWSFRTSPVGNVFMSGAPLFAEEGTGYGSRTVDYLHDDLLRFPGVAPPVPLSSDASPWHGGVLAAYGVLLVTRAVDTGQGAGMPNGIEVRCRQDGSILAVAGTVRGEPLLGGASAWFFADVVSRHDVASGSLLWRVKPLPPPPVPPPGYRNAAPCASPPLLTSSGTILFIDQQGQRGGSSAEQALGTPVLHEIDLDGRETLRRALPLETECYGGPLALQGGRLFAGGQVTPSSGGVIRAFDLPVPREPAGRGWMGPGGSQARDQRAR